jgi:hypothetical protein
MFDLQVEIVVVVVPVVVVLVEVEIVVVELVPGAGEVLPVHYNNWGYNQQNFQIYDDYYSFYPLNHMLL